MWKRQKQLFSVNVNFPDVNFTPGSKRLLLFLLLAHDALFNCVAFCAIHTGDGVNFRTITIFIKIKTLQL